MIKSDKKAQNVLLPFANQWVALARDYSRVVAAAKTVQKLEQKLDAIKDKNSILMFVESPVGYYSPLAR